MSENSSRWSLLPASGQSGTEFMEKYLVSGGYQAARRVVAGLTADNVVSAVAHAALRGRGGGGFPVARKWEHAREHVKAEAYVVANAYDADPNAPVARALLEHNPHAVLEGMIIAAFATGAHEAYVYLRGDNAEANRRLRAAVSEAEEHGYLGESAFDGAWPLIVRAVVGWGGFSGGEETAALEAIEGKRAMPRQKPPFPTESGLWGSPTVVHSVETLANLPAIFNEGPQAYGASTKIVALGGDVANPGLVEIPLGTPLRAIVERAGGVSNGRSLKAIQVGGPTGAVLPDSLLDTPLEYDALAKVGAFIGSGSLVALAEDVCAVDFARERMTYLSQEACGKCVPCRLGTSRMAATLEGIVSGLGRKEDLDLIEEYATVMADGSLCGFGITAPAVLRSTLAHFGEEYRAHIEEGRCATGRCQPLRTRRFERKTAV